MDGLWWLTSCVKMKHNLAARNPVLASREFTETCRVTSFSPICVEPPATPKLDEAEKNIGWTYQHTHIACTCWLVRPPEHFKRGPPSPKKHPPCARTERNENKSLPT